MDGMVIFWFIIGLLFLIAELGSPGFFFFFSFFLGALIAAGSSLFIASIIAQLFVFLGGTIVAFLLFQLWVRSRGARLTKKQETNIDALKGKRAVVVKAIGPNNPGYISLYGVLWLARSAHYNAIPEESWVEVVDMKGAHLLVVEVSESIAK